MFRKTSCFLADGGSELVEIKFSDLFDATEEWFRNNVPKAFIGYSDVEKEVLEKWKTKILKTEIPHPKIRKISDLPDASETMEEDGEGKFDVD